MRSGTCCLAQTRTRGRGSCKGSGTETSCGVSHWESCCSPPNRPSACGRVLQRELGRMDRSLVWRECVGRSRSEKLFNRRVHGGGLEGDDRNPHPSAKNALGCGTQHFASR